MEIVRSLEPCGSSPRMRGKPPRSDKCQRVRRIIPAHAGQTFVIGARGLGKTDHPRACGANVSVWLWTPSATGSSPRMRGKPGANGAVVMGERIIPAHAGQTPRPRATPTARTDHPRACGANSAGRPSNILQSGSSPRMRGKPERLFVRACRPRIIPAHAGQTAPGHRTISRCSDHPRACGANRGTSIECPPTGGSSPRMRGKRQGSDGRRPETRIIPAHAGQTAHQ